MFTELEGEVFDVVKRASEAVVPFGSRPTAIDKESRGFSRRFEIVLPDPLIEDVRALSMPYAMKRD